MTATAEKITKAEPVEPVAPPELALVWLDPRVLVDHPRNVRRELGDLTGLTASIREEGVIEPLSVIPGPDGTFVLDAGHRRKHAARSPRTCTATGSPPARKPRPTRRCWTWA